MHTNADLPIALDHCVIASSDLDRSDAFYSAVFGARVEAPLPNFRHYYIGDAMLSVHGPGLAALAPPELLASHPVVPGNSDLCFRWTGSKAALQDHLTACGIATIFGPAKRQGAICTGTSFYFRDPDGSLLEFLVADSSDRANG